jgi:hypothetical protein
MQRCPNCQSRRFYGNEQVGWKCYKCGYENIPSPLMQKAKCDGGITDNVKPSQSHHYSSLDWQNSTRTLSMNQTLISSPLFQEIHDLHDNAWKFKIIHDADVDWPRQKGFDGSIQRSEFNGHRIAKTKNWLIIFKDGRNKVPLKDLYMTSNFIMQGIIETAQEIARRFNFEIEPIPLLFSRNKPEVKTPFLSATNFIEEEAKSVYAQPTAPGPIEMQGKNAVKNSLNLSAMLEDFRIVMEREIVSKQLEIQNKQLHQHVLEHMDETLRKIEDNVRRPEGLSVKILKFFGLLSAKVKSKTATSALLERADTQKVQGGE